VKSVARQIISLIGGIRRYPSPFSAIYDGQKENKKISYCPECAKNGFNEILHKSKLRFNQETKKRDLIQDIDADRYMQCRRCGDIIEVYKVKKESVIEDAVETTDNPFDNNPEDIKTLKQEPGIIQNKYKSSAVQRKKEQIKREKDIEVRAFLEIGATLTYYNED
jgi:hypothetical protein